MRWKFSHLILRIKVFDGTELWATVTDILKFYRDLVNSDFRFVDLNKQHTDNSSDTQALNEPIHCRESQCPTQTHN